MELWMSRVVKRKKSDINLALTLPLCRTVSETLPSFAKVLRGQS